MSLRQQAKILGVHHSTLSKCISGQRAWNPELKARYEELTATTQENNGGKTNQTKLGLGGGDARLLGVNNNHGGRYKSRTYDLCDVNAAL